MTDSGFVVKVDKADDGMTQVVTSDGGPVMFFVSLLNAVGFAGHVAYQHKMDPVSPAVIVSGYGPADGTFVWDGALFSPVPA